MHDYFQILGVSDAAPADEIRRAFRRRAARSHPDFRDGESMSGPADAGGPSGRDLGDIAIDFVDMSAIVDRMQAAFFGRRSS